MEWKTTKKRREATKNWQKEEVRVKRLAFGSREVGSQPSSESKTVP